MPVFRLFRWAPAFVVNFYFDRHWVSFEGSDDSVGFALIFHKRFRGLLVDAPRSTHWHQDFDK